MYTLKIKVTKEILRKSMYCGTELSTKDTVGANCAFALALRDIFPYAHVTATGIDFFYHSSTDKDLLPVDQVKLPLEAGNFIFQFDNVPPPVRLTLPEIEVEISIPDEVINQINIDELRPLLENHPTLSLINN